MNRQAWIAVGSAIGVGVAVVVIIIAASVPLPEFPPLAPDQVDGSLAFVTDTNCIRVAELADAGVRELHCVSEQDWINNLVWTETGIEVGVDGFQSKVVVLDPETGDVIETRGGDFSDHRPGWDQELSIDVTTDGEIVIRVQNNQVLITLKGPERYGIDTVIGAPNGQAVALIDSSDRLAVFDRNVGEAYLVDTEARDHPAPAWHP